MAVGIGIPHPTLQNSELCVLCDIQEEPAAVYIDGSLNQYTLHDPGSDQVHSLSANGGLTSSGMTTDWICIYDFYGCKSQLISTVNNSLNADVFNDTALIFLTNHLNN